MIITLKGADFSQSNIGTLDSWFISWSGSGLTAAAGNATSIKKKGTSTTPLTYTYNTENYEYVSGTVKDATGATVGSISASNGTVTVTINAGNTINGKITIAISMNYIGTGEEPETPGGGSGSGGTEPTPGGTTWYINSLDAVAATGKDLTGGTVFTGSSIAPVAFDNTFNAKLVGKTIDTVEFVPEKAGTITFGLYNTTTYAYTEKASITIEEADLNTRKTYTFTPFTVSSGELFTFYKSGDVGCMSYYLATDVAGVDYCKGLQTKCNGAAPTAFNHDLVTLINIGNSSGGSSGDEPTTPTDATWYINSLQGLQDSGNDIATNRVKLQGGGSAYAWAFNELNTELAGKTINTIEMMPSGAGTFHLGVFDTSTNKVTDTRTFTIEAADVDTVKTYKFTDLTIPSGKYFVWNCSGATGEGTGYYILQAKLDPLAVKTSKWYQAKPTGLVAFGEHVLAFVANIGYTS